MPEAVVDVLVPTTDAGAIGQLVGLAVVAPLAIAASWRHREVRTFVIGLIMITLAWFALRTVH